MHDSRFLRMELHAQLFQGAERVVNELFDERA
jgi:hypothetical protein